MHILDTWGVLWEGETQFLTSRRRKDQHKSYRRATALHVLYFSLEKMKQAQYRLLGYCLFQLFIKKKSEQENKKIKIGSEVT